MSFGTVLIHDQTVIFLFLCRNLAQTSWAHPTPERKMDIDHILVLESINLFMTTPTPRLPPLTSSKK